MMYIILKLESSESSEIEMEVITDSLITQLVNGGECYELYEFHDLFSREN